MMALPDCGKRQYVHSFRFNTTTCRTDGQTEMVVLCMLYNIQYNTMKTVNVRPLVDYHEGIIMEFMVSY